MNIAIAASSDVNIVWALSAAIVVLSEMPKPGTTVLLRRPRSGKPMEFESMVEPAARRLGHRVEWCQPPADAHGRAATFLRDITMAERADLMLALFSPKRVMDGGTGHLVEKAVDQRVPVWGYVVKRGIIERIGEHEPFKPTPELRDVYNVLQNLHGRYTAGRDGASSSPDQSQTPPTD